MSEWYDSQKKSSSNFCKLLQERIEKVNPRRKLTAEEVKRLAKLETIANKLKRGENVQNRQLQTWLGEEEYEQLETEWQEQLSLRETLKDKPSELKRYEDKLKQATFSYNRAEGFSNKGKHSTAKNFYNKSESLCEDALEILQEILHYDSSLRVWFDRDISFEVGGDLSADIVSLPRIVTSRSHEKLSDDSRLTSKKMEAIQQQMVEAKKNERANALKEVKRLCKEFGFTAGMLKGALAKGRGEK